MATEEILEGARNGLTFFYAYLNLVSQEIGMEHAIDLSVKVNEMMGDANGRRIKEQFGDKDIDISTATMVALHSIKDAFGITSEVIEKSPKRMVVRCSRCPVYDAAQSVGIDNETKETLCRKGSLKFMDAMVKQLNPNLSYQLVKFRSGSDECCEEEILMS